MIQHIHHIILSLMAFSAVVLTQSCSRNEEDRMLPSEQIPLSDFSFSFGVDGLDVYTKAGQSVRQENRVTGLYIMLFDEKGQLVHRKSYFVGSGQKPERYNDRITNYTEKDSETAGASMGVIERFFDGFNDYTALDNNMTFYAVANYNTSIESQLKDITYETELQDLRITFSTAGNVFRTNFLMIARQTGIAFNVNDDNGQPTIDRIGVNLQLRRIDAKITFNVSVEIEDATNLAFENMIYRIHNVPNVTYLFEQQKGSAGNNTWDAAGAAQADGQDGYSCMMDDNYDTFDSTYSDRVGGEFSFYLRENRPLPKKEITRNEQGDWTSLYAMREAWEGGSPDSKTPVHGREFTYAPEFGTFVEISGNLSYSHINEEGKNEEVYGDVTYIIHLGETGNDANNQEAVNNYDVRRNVRYIYNVRITGINNMEVEVYTQTEERPGIEGDLTISTNRRHSFDAHYGRVLLELDKRNLEKAGWSAVTPLGTIEYNPETGLINEPYDYKWVLFAINRQFDRYNDGSSMVKFPGIQAYDGGIKFFELTGEDQIREAIKNDLGNNLNGNKLTFKNYVRYYDFNNYYSTRHNELDDDACLRDINQLLNYLKQKMKEDTTSYIFDDNIVYITAFVDEYTYLYDPRIEDYIHPGESVANHGQSEASRRLGLWKEYTNTGDRSLNILPMTNISYSPDGNTSITNAYITLTQNSIKTIYNTGDSLTTAWGLETTNETGSLTYESRSRAVGSRTNTTSDGRTNFINFWIEGNDRWEGNGSINWTSAMTVNGSIDNADALNYNYRDAYHACITRNRDLNGNNFIDKDEIYWYLAAKDQLAGLFIGQSALEQSAWLYQGDGTEINHVVTSSYYSGSSFSSTNFWMLWSEEGASWGRVRGSSDTATTYDYRCIRNLGIDIAQQDQSPSHYAETSGPHYDYEGDTQYYTIDVSRINSRALRSSQDDGINLPLDNERSQNNRPYRAFDVRLGDVQSSYNWLTMENALNGNANPCPTGWRVPNQREFLIMISSLVEPYTENSPFTWGNIGYILATATTFSFNGVSPLYSNGIRYGFLYKEGNLFLHNGGESDFRFRCVRDHTGN